MQHADEVSKAAEREASLAVALGNKGTAAADGAAALAAAQEGHVLSLKALHAKHSAALKIMQVCIQI